MSRTDRSRQAARRYACAGRYPRHSARAAHPTERSIRPASLLVGRAVSEHLVGRPDLCRRNRNRFGLAFNDLADLRLAIGVLAILAIRRVAVGSSDHALDRRFQAILVELELADMRLADAMQLIDLVEHGVIALARHL